MYRAAAAHGLSKQVDAVIVDEELFAREIQDVHHVLLAQFAEVLGFGAG